MSVDLSSYITDAKAKKVPDDKIKAALVSAGWPENQVMTALQQTAGDGLLPPPPPPTVAHIGMWIGFLYILFFIALYTLMSSIAGIFHNWVDLAIPDTKNALSAFGRSSMTYLTQGMLAALIVAYPIFLILAIVLKKQIVKNPLVRNLRSRKLLVYITLIVTFLIILCHVIAIIYSFLGGSLTGNAMGHLGVTFLIAGSVFGYFLNEIKHDSKND